MKWLPLICLLFLACKKKDSSVSIITLGDSYTFCQGISKDSCWVEVLIQDLKKNAVDAELSANPAIPGYTTNDLITHEIPVLKNKKPDLVILMIGTNDIFRGISSEKSRSNYRKIVDMIQNNIDDKSNLILLTIPDFTISPVAPSWNLSPAMKLSIQDFNLFIKTEASKRNLELVDIEKLSTSLGSDPEMYADDGLHPSAGQYLIWEKQILPAVLQRLSK